MRSEETLKRCSWCGSDPLYRRYHDTEWGVPVSSDQKLYEFLVLEAAQAGLSWITILRRRQGYRQAFAQFDPRQVAQFDSKVVQKLLQNPQIIRNRRKIESAIGNARAFLEVQQQWGSFSHYLWDFVDGRPITHRYRTWKEIPSQSPLSRRLSRDLRQRGFSFVGPTIMYAFLQAMGLVNDHVVSCYRHRELSG